MECGSTWSSTGPTLLELTEDIWGQGVCSDPAESWNIDPEHSVTERISYVVNEKFFYSIFHIRNVLSSRLN